MSNLRYILPVLLTLGALFWFFNPGGLRPPATSTPELRYDIGAIEACTLDALMSFEAANTDLADRIRQHDRNGRPSHELVGSAEGGNADAMFELGVYYALIAQSEDENRLAGAWLEQAAKAGQLDAQNEIGIGYAYGYYGVAEDDELARDWLKQAANRGDARAQNALAGLYQTGNLLPSPEDTRNARQIALQLQLDAASQCFPAALNAIAERLASGRGVPRNAETGAYLTTLIAEFRDAGGFVETN